MKQQCKAVAISVALILAAGSVQARDVEELIVSVRKSEENIQEVPIQVTNIGSEIVRSENVTGIEGVAELTPSLLFDQGFWVQDTRVTIRGLFNRAGRPSAAILIDGIDASGEAFESSGGSALVNQRLIDIERIEVARGPQSAQFGRAAFAGAINYITRRPPEEFEIAASGQLAEGGRAEIRGSVGGSLVDSVLTAKVYASHYEQDGDYTNPNTGGDLASGDSDGIGLALEWTPSDEVSLYWNTTYTEDAYSPQAVALVQANEFIRVEDDGSERGVLIRNADPSCDTGAGDACLAAVTGTIDASESDIDIAPDPRNGMDFPGSEEKTVRSNLILDWDIQDGLAFRSKTSFTDSRQNINFDSTQIFSAPPQGAPTGNFADARNFFEYKQYFQEFQLQGDSADGKVNWFVGVNAFIEDAQDLNNSRFWYRSPLVCLAIFTTAACTFEDAPIFGKFIERDTTSYSIFGLYGWQLNDQWKLTLEGRLIRDEVEIESNTADLGADALGSPPPTLPPRYPGSPGFEAEVSDTNFLPRVTLDYTPNEQTLIYASVAKGIKPPTFNTTDLRGPDPVTGETPNAVDKEELWTYEIGTKNTLYDGKLLLNGAIYYNDYTDQQVRVQFPAANPTIPNSGAVNAGEVSVWGLEVDSSWVPTDRWLVNVSYAYTKGEYDDFVLAEVQEAGAPGVPLSRSEQAKAGNLLGDLTGLDTPGVPEHAATLLARYTAPFVNDLEWFGQASVSWQSERYADKSNLVELDSYTLANAQIGLQEEAWTVSVFVDNVFDDDTIRYAQEFIDQSQGFQFTTLTYPVGYFAYLPQPRTLGIRFSYRTP